MLRGLAIIGFVASCSFSASTQPAGDDAPMVDAAVPLEVSSDDLDGDGVTNASDNCPMVANAGQYDEDADERGDECDPCPHLGTPAANGDGDGDGVGDGCDPRPSTPGDAIAYWNGFNVNGAGVPAPMAMLHGNAARWSVANGTLVYTRGDVTDWGMPVVDVGKPHHVIDATFDIVTTYTGPRAGGVAVDINATDTDMFECQSRTDTGRRELWRRDTSDPDGWTIVDFEAAVTGAEDYHLVLDRTQARVACSNQRGQLVPVELVGTVGSLGNTRAGLFARNVDMSFRYMIVITSP